MLSSKSSKSSSTARLAITSLIAALLTTTPLASLPANAVGIVYNDGVCDLTVSSGTTYAINNADELWEIADCSGAGNIFELQNDIDVTAASDAPTSSPIGTSTSAITFSGTLDGAKSGGGNWEISGISISATSLYQTNRHSGLFALIENAEIKNLTLGGAVSTTETSFAGGVAGRAMGVVTLSGVVNEATVDSGGNSGGFIGILDGDSTLTIHTSENKARITSTVNNAGGMVGSMKKVARLMVEASTNSGAVVTGGKSGGLVGYLNDDSVVTIRSFLNSGDINSSDSSGGLLGVVDDGGNITIEASSNEGDVLSSAGRVGGLVGRFRDDSGNNVAVLLIREASNAGDIQGVNEVGGLVGESQGAASISNSVNRGAISGQTRVGGLAGEANQLSVEKSSNEGQISGTQSVAGLVGEIKGAAEFAEAFNSGNVSTANSGDDTAAGLVATMDDNTAGHDISIVNSYNSGTISASFAIGLAFYGSQIDVTNSYNVGTAGTEGLVKSFTQVNLSSTYTNQDSAEVVPTSTDLQLQQAATYVGWDFNAVWGFVCGTNNNFPVLRFAYPSATSIECPPTNNSQPGQDSDPEPAPAPTYTGPTLVSETSPVAAGNSVTFTGSKLDVVTMAMIGTTAVTISATTQTSLTIMIPVSVAAATYDLVLFSSFGTLTVMGAVTVEAAEPVSETKAELLGWSWTLKFVGNSRSLSDAQQAHLENQIELHPDAATVICWGYTTAASPNAWAIAHATQRAQSACDLVSETNPDLKTVVRLRYGLEKSWAMRSAVQFWG